MPIYLDIDRLERVVMFVARGDIDDEDIRQAVANLLAADVPSFAKIIDNSAAAEHESSEQIAAIVRLLREAPGHETRGPVAYVIDPRRPGVSGDFAGQSAADRPIRCFTSLREARQWARETMEGGL